MHTQSILVISSSILCSSWVPGTAISPAMSITIGAYQEDNFEFARWLLMDGVVLFTFGVFWTGLSILVDQKHELAGRGPG